MIKILNIEPDGYSSDARGILDQLGTVDEFQGQRSELISIVQDYDVLIVRLAHEINRELIEAAKRLKVIVSATTGLDHIDLNYAAERAVEVLSLKGEITFLETISATAEHTWALLLSLIRRIPGAAESVRNGGWDRDSFKGSELDGKRLGVLGLGRIGRKVAKYGVAFGMTVSAFDPMATQWPDSVERMTSLEALLGQIDVLSIHVPLNTETTGLISRTELQTLPAGSIVVNTSRGEVVNEIALLESLESGHLGGAALDVVSFERQAASRGGGLIEFARNSERLLITPHIGGATNESMWKTEIFMAQKLQRLLTTSGKFIGRRAQEL
jgi:D-3-phosphoglycerate dehydrogenase / 2-oxoglutarate reductase